MTYDIANVWFMRQKHGVAVPIARSSEQWHRGLRGVKHAAEAWMLFPTLMFPDAPVSMTMTGMSVPLDFIFLKRSGAPQMDGSWQCVVDHIMARIPPGRPIVEPPRWVPWVLEAPSGWVTAIGLRRGDRIAIATR